MKIRTKIQTALLALAALGAPQLWADTQFRVIVDASGSMVISDPDKLTSEALKLISNLAPEEKATLGIWLFGERPRVLLPESPVTPELKQQLARYVDGYVTEDLKTDLESILRLLLQTPDSGELAPDFDRHWILVTDGMVDISLDDKVNAASRARITDNLAVQLAEKGIHLHTVSMTGYTDKELLQSLSDLTNASHTEVATPEELLDTFDRVFAQAAPSEELPFEGNTFFVDDAVEEATLLVFHEPGITPAILKPGGVPLSLTASNVSTAAAKHYTMVTITKPVVGTWSVENIDLARSSIRVITKLSAQATKVPPVLFINEPIYSTVGLFQDDRLLTDEQILDLVDVRQKLIFLAGETPKQLRDIPVQRALNQYKNKIERLIEQGNYQLATIVDGKTFTRQLNQYFSVAPAIELQVEPASESLVRVRATPTNLRLNTLRSNAKLVVDYHSGTEQVEEMTLQGAGYWEKVLPVTANATLSIRVRLVGVTRTGMRFDYDTPVWSVIRNGADQVSVKQGPLPAQAEPELDALAALGAVNRTVAPVVVTPQIAVVDEPETTPPTAELDDAPTAQVEDETSPVEEPPVAPVGLTTTEWLLYGGLNLLAVALAGGGYFFWRRRKAQRQQQEGEVEDV
ncbi:VWA domain-containing protein [Maribrevibacterium harenarium]|uniref:VWA domain-containing protein n=1 Tax=Maribrevibacterium harenarium TaxID=2589817 RepID=UPI001F1F8BAD|nr:VWA domain-containing protein [Maribrevibacterium harenarium]